MKKIILDINVVLDFLLKRNNHEMAARTINTCLEKKIKIFLCAHEITTISYFLNKEYKNHKKVISILEKLFTLFHILDCNQKVLRLAIHSEIKDYEDAVIESTAFQNNIDAIITHNLKDFKHSKTTTLDPASFLMQEQK